MYCFVFVLFIQAKTPNITVQLKMEYSITPLVHVSFELQPLLQLASSKVNLSCGVVDKFSISSFNSWIPLGLRLAGTRMISQSLRRCFRNSLYKYVRPRRIVVGVTGFKLTISMCSLIR